MNEHCFEWIHNSKRLQSPLSNVCGEYCIAYVLLHCNGFAMRVVVITRYPCCIVLLVLFNKIRVHSYDTVLCSFFVSSLAPLIAINNPVNDRCC